MKKACKAIDLI